MKLKYLGTAAAEGFPALFCNCNNCQKALKEKGRNIRSRSQAIVDGRLLIDFPCDTYYHCLLNGIDLNDVQHCLITHVHSDHLYTKDLNYLEKWFSHPKENYHLTVYGSVDAENELTDIAGRLSHLAFVRINPFEPVTVGAYTVVALKAYHGTANPYIYSISDGIKTLLYAHDTDLFPEETWAYIRQNGLRFDLVSLDCTEGAKTNMDYRGHMCLERNIACRNRLLESNAIDSHTVIVLNHFSHNGVLTTYSDFAPLAARNGFEASYDGMEIELP